MTTAQERIGRNEALFREINERIAEAAADHGPDGHVYEFLCECADPGCLTRVELPLAAYERVRASGRRFVVAPGHSLPGMEAVVEAAPGHAIVEKQGEAGRTAAALDPRAG